MWRTNIKILALVLGVLGVYTLIANSIPQIQSEVPQALDLSGDVTPQQLAAAGERIYLGAGGCTACHGLGTRAPNLLTDEGGAGTIGARCGNRKPGTSCKDYLYEALTAPGAFVVAGYQPIMQDMRRTMPADQIWAVIAYLESLGGTIDVTADDVKSAQSAAPAAAPTGASASLEPRAIMTANACLGCHKLGNEGAQVGPPFDGMGSRLTADQIRQGILNPNATVARGFEAMAGSMPPNFGTQLNAAQLEALVAFLGEPPMSEPVGGGRVRVALRHPFWQAVTLLIGAYLLFKFGVRYLPPLLGMKSAPVPSTVVAQYMITALVGILIYVSDSESRWRLFKEPINAGLVDADKKWIRITMLVLVPLTVGFVTWQGVRPSVAAGAQLRSIHPAPPSSITLRGATQVLTGLENPLRTSGSMAEHLTVGRRVYYQNCVFCHGDRFDGQGHYALAFNPAPLSFADNGTIAQLTESYVFWRIAKGGIGLPREGAPWNSAMPAWENFLTDQEIWAVIIYLYDHTGWRPRTWSEEGGSSEH